MSQSNKINKNYRLINHNFNKIKLIYKPVVFSTAFRGCDTQDSIYSIDGLYCDKNIISGEIAVIKDYVLVYNNTYSSVYQLVYNYKSNNYKLIYKGRLMNISNIEPIHYYIIQLCRQGYYNSGIDDICLSIVQETDQIIYEGVYTYSVVYDKVTGYVSIDIFVFQRKVNVGLYGSDYNIYKVYEQRVCADCSKKLKKYIKVLLTKCVHKDHSEEYSVFIISRNSVSKQITSKTVINYLIVYGANIHLPLLTSFDNGVLQMYLLNRGLIGELEDDIEDTRLIKFDNEYELRVYITSKAQDEGYINIRLSEKDVQITNSD